MNPPRVSVLMCVYNGEDYLREAVDSILHQTYRDFEFIIVDDTSTDDTPYLLREYAQQDERIIVIRNPLNLGLTASLNIGLRAAQGEIIARQDADDISQPDRLEKQVAALDTQPDAVLVTANVIPINADSQPAGERPPIGAPPYLIRWYLLFYNYLYGHSLVTFRRKPALDVGGYDETKRYAQDHDLWLRLTPVGDFLILPDQLLKLRVHDDNISRRHNPQQFQTVLDTSRTHIEALTGETFEPVQIEMMTRFWMGGYPKHQAALIHAGLQRIVPAFIQREKLDDDQQRDLRRVIARRFLGWVESLQNSPTLEVKISRLAWQWSPALTAAYWRHHAVPWLVEMVR